MVRFDALVFDMDGTLVDNMRVHVEVWKEFGRRQGWDADAPDFVGKVAHGTLTDVLGRVFGRPPTREEVRGLGEAKEALYREVYGPRMAPLAGLRELLAAARAAALRIGMYTNAPWSNVDFVVDRLALRAEFDAFVTAADVSRGKPDPEGYRLAAERLRLPPARCVAFEDSPHGVASAKAAGMAAVGVATWQTPEALRQADLVVADFADPRLAAFVGLPAKSG
jgi:HAD superfamily hydrolase (TIGR01509 family)